MGKISRGSKEKAPNLKMHETDIIIPVYEQHDLTMQCIESVRKYTYRYRIILVNNGTPKKEFEAPDICLIQNDSNLGFVKAVNQGITVSLVSGTPWIVLLNNDTKVCSNWLSQMRKVARMYPSCGLVGPIMRGPHGWQSIQNIRKKLNIKPPVKEVRRVMAMVAFFCVLIKRQVFETVGFLSEEFGAGLGDDDDFCARARKAGFLVLLDCNTIITHRHRTTFKMLYSKDEIEKMQKENLLLYKRKHHIPL